MLGEMIAAIARVHLSADDLALVAAGTNPHDLMDFNVCIYGGFCAVYFREPNFESDADVEAMNAATEAALAILRVSA